MKGGNCMQGFSFAHIPGLAPTLLVEMALALIYRRRWPGPCMRLLCGTARMYVVSLAPAFLVPSLVCALMNAGGNLEQVELMMMNLFALGSSLLNALGLGWVLAAVLVGRREKLDRPA